MKPLHMLAVAVLGLVFGLLLSRSGAADYDTIQRMFLLTDFQLYGIIGTAVVVGAAGMALLRRRGRGQGGQLLSFGPKQRHRGNLVGGVLFGIGWAITGMCPGPILVNIGEGKIYALAALAGVLCGTWVLGTGYETWRRIFGLPEAGIGTGDG